MDKKEFLGYKIEGEKLGILADAPCSCPGCDEGWQLGHRYCNPPTPELLAAEERREIYRTLENSGWYWVIRDGKGKQKC